MSGTTSRLGIYLIGGGLSGTYGADEVVNVDKVNEGFEKLDEVAGLFVCLSTARPAVPFEGQPIYETDTDKLLVWSSGAWQTVAVPPIPAATPTTANVATFGAIWSVTPGAGHVPRLHLVDGVVTLTGAMTLNAGASPNNILTVPLAFRPANVSTRFVGTGVSSAGVAYALTLSTGVLAIPTGYNAASLVGGTVIPVSSSWTMD